MTVAPTTMGYNKYFVRIRQQNTDCPATGTDSVKVIGMPAVTIAQTPAQDTVCNGYEYTFKANVSTSSNGTYVWTRNGAILSNSQADQSILYDAPEATGSDIQQFIYGVRFTQEGTGCDTTVYDTVYVVPAYTVTITGTQDTCYDNTTATQVELKATVSDNYPGINSTITWSKNGVASTAATLTGNTDTKTENLTDGTYIFTALVAGDYGCSVESEPFTVNVYSNPIPEIVVSDSTICVNGEVAFEVRIANGDENVTYQWFCPDSVGYATASTYTHTFTTAGDVVAKVKAVRNGLCSAEATQTIHVNEVPTVQIADAISDTICGGLEILLSARNASSTIIPAEAYTYTWYKNGIEVEGVTD